MWDLHEISSVGSNLVRPWIARLLADSLGYLFYLADSHFFSFWMLGRALPFLFFIFIYGSISGSYMLGG